MAEPKVVITRKQAHSKVNSKACVVVEYIFPSETLGFALAQIDGRYPGAGRMINEKVDIIYYVLSGKAVIHQPDGDFQIRKGDCFFLRKGTWYWIEAEALKIAVPSSPAWHPEQYRHLD